METKQDVKTVYQAEAVVTGVHMYSQFYESLEEAQQWIEQVSDLVRRMIYRGPSLGLLYRIHEWETWDDGEDEQCYQTG